MTALAIRDGALDSLKAEAGISTNRQLASYIGVSESVVSRVKDDPRKLSAQFIASVLDAFPVKFEEIFIIETTSLAA